jgi:hypothetical protein
VDRSDRLQVGFDFSLKQVTLCLLRPDGALLDTHQSFPNSVMGFQQAKTLILRALAEQHLQGVDLAGEATSYYWLPYFVNLAQDPDLAPFDPHSFLLNPGWVKWYKKSFPPDNKSDDSDPYYIADRMRTLTKKVQWDYAPRWLSLRFYTRLRHHLAQTLAREKNYFHLLLFLSYSGYAIHPPFTHPFLKVSQHLLNHPQLMDQFVELPLEDLAICLNHLSGNRLKDPPQNAHKLKRALAESFSFDPDLSEPIQNCLHAVQKLLASLQAQITQVDQLITQHVQANYPEVDWLRSIPGVGPVFSSGICAEIAGLQRFKNVPHWDKKRKCYRSRTVRDVEDAVAKFAGLWWPKNASGDFEAEERRMSKKGNPYLRYFILQAANSMRLHIPSYARFYRSKYEQATKHHHKRALVLTGRKAIGLFVGLLHHQESYRPEEV